MERVSQNAIALDRTSGHLPLEQAIDIYQLEG
jgi:hypothetical protein